MGVLSVPRVIISQARFYGSAAPRINALIIGAPGSGKGTISNWIVRDFKLQHVSSGDLLRSHIQKGTDLGKKAKVGETVLRKKSNLRFISITSHIFSGFYRSRRSRPRRGHGWSDIFRAEGSWRKELAAGRISANPSPSRSPPKGNSRQCCSTSQCPIPNYHRQGR
jgi:hypothetical protein